MIQLMSSVSEFLYEKMKSSKYVWCWLVFFVFNGCDGVGEKIGPCNDYLGSYNIRLFASLTGINSEGTRAGLGFDANFSASSRLVSDENEMVQITASFNSPVVIADIPGSMDISVSCNTGAIDFNPEAIVFDIGALQDSYFSSNGSFFFCDNEGMCLGMVSGSILNTSSLSPSGGRIEWFPSDRRIEEEFSTVTLSFSR